MSPAACCGAQTLPIFLDKLLDPLGAILISVTMVLIFGERVCDGLRRQAGTCGRACVWRLSHARIGRFRLRGV